MFQLKLRIQISLSYEDKKLCEVDPAQLFVQYLILTGYSWIIRKRRIKDWQLSTLIIKLIVNSADKYRFFCAHVRILLTIKTTYAFVTEALTSLHFMFCSKKCANQFGNSVSFNNQFSNYTITQNTQIKLPKNVLHADVITK